MKQTFVVFAHLVCAFAVLTGCTSAVTQLQRGRVLDRLQFEVNVGGSLPLSGKAVRTAIAAEETVLARIDAADAAATENNGVQRNGVQLNRDDARQLTEVAAAVLLFTPLPNAEFSVRGGIGWNVDIGLRRSGPRTQLDVKWQALHARRHGVDLGLSLAVARHSSPAPSLWNKVIGASESLKIATYARQDVTLSIITSRDIGKVFSIWVALAWSRSQISIGSQLVGIAADLNLAENALDIDAVMQQYGGQFGFRVGYEYVFILVEFSVMQANFKPEILGEKVDLSGILFTPSIALQVTF